MYKIIIYIFLFLLHIQSFTQSIQNVRFQQAGEKVVIYYDLKDRSAAGNSFSISVYYTVDNGFTYLPLKSAFGDVGNNISAGNDKKVTWNVLNDVDELSGEVKFKVVANAERRAVTFWDYDVFVSARSLGYYWPFGGRIGMLGPKRVGFYLSFLYGIRYETWEEKYIGMVGAIVNLANSKKFRFSAFTGGGFYYYDEYDEYYSYYYGYYTDDWIEHSGYLYEVGMIFNFNHLNLTLGLELTDILTPFVGVGITL